MPRVLAYALVLAALASGRLTGQDAPPPADLPQAPADGEPVALAVTPRFPADRWISTREPVALELSAALEPGAGRLAVFLGTTDVTALTAQAGATITLRPGNVPLPHGETELSLHLVSADGEWREIGRFPIRLLDRSGFQELGLLPKLDLTSDGQLDQGGSGPPPDRRTYQDLTLSLGFQGTASRPGWMLRSQANAVGVTREEQRLRFAERGLDAPAVDLSDYLVALERGAVQLELGHVSFGSSRHLVSGVGSRGASGRIRLGSVARLGLAAMNGSSIVGWNNPLGLSRPEHRLLAAELGLELVPRQPGLVQLGATVLDGSVLPVAGYTQGVVNDTEEGRGFGLQLTAGDPAQRVRIGAGFTRASFTNPADPLLEQGASLVPVRSATRNARYLEATVQLVRGAMLSPTLQAGLSGAFRHERVDPLYRSVATPVRADWNQEVYEATGTLGRLAVQYSHGRSRDNLDDVPSILTTRTRTHNLTAAVPAGALFRAPLTAWWWPVLSAAYQVTRQAGEGVPENGGFSASHVPDQLSRDATLGVTWQQARWSVTYRHNVSRQDNRQPGREEADFRAWVHAVTLGVTPLDAVTLALDLAQERQRSIEADRLQRTSRVGLQADWRVLANTTLQGYLARTESDDQPLTLESGATELRVEASQGFDLYRRAASGTQARAFLRYARSAASQAGPALAPEPDRTLWSLAAGLSLRLY